MNNRPLGEIWFERFYPRIQQALGFDRDRDEEARDTLAGLLKTDATDLVQQVNKLARGNQVVMFGAGPSLESDIMGLSTFLEKRHPLVVAADGAADALYLHSIVPEIIVTDLDSCTRESLDKCSASGTIFAHAHGDNIELVKELIPSFGNSVIGTTQVASVQNVTNYGGLTDGDRACFVISSFEPSSIIMAGMDFGSSEGRYSMNKHSSETNPSRPTKLALGRESLEFLIRSRPAIRFRNVTRYGEEISGASKEDYSSVI